MPSGVTVTPSAHRLTHSMRDVGYTLVAAVTDLVNNSIAANATEVSIDLVFEGANSWVQIADNGEGMDGPALNEAMRLGTDREYGELAPGEFGLGLKTASCNAG